MLVVRSVKEDDLDSLYELACGAGEGLTTLPSDKEMLRERIALSQKSFSTSYDMSGDQYYFMVLEDLELKKVVGTTAIFADVGKNQPFYNYRLLKLVQVSHNPPIKVETNLLNLANDYTNGTELATLYLHPDYRVSGYGRVLSKCRFLLMAAYPKRFSETVFAEVRGWVDEEGKSPFWNAVGGKFFDMEFDEADRVNGLGNNQFIGDVMPKFPIYSNLLPETARSVIGKPHVKSAAAMKFLEEEGFRYRGAVDIFDAGPLVEASQSQIRSVRNATSAIVSAIPDEVDGDMTLLASPDIANFKVVRAPVHKVNGKQDRIEIPELFAQILGVEVGMEVLYLDQKEHVKSR